MVIWMKTTLNIDDSVMALLKHEAARRGCTMSELVESALRLLLMAKEGPRALRRPPTPWYSTWGIMYEFLRVITHPRIFHKPWTAPKAWDFVEAILAAPSFGLLAPSERHAEVAAGGRRQRAN